MDFIIVYNIIYTKPEWNRDTALAHLLVNGQRPLGCEENECCLCFLLKEKSKDEEPSLMVPLSDSVALIIKNVGLPQQDLGLEEEKKEEKEC